MNKYCHVLLSLKATFFLKKNLPKRKANYYCTKYKVQQKYFSHNGKSDNGAFI